MASLEQNLGISNMLIGVDQHMSDWGVQHRELGALGTLDDFVRATNTGTFQDRDDVLLALAARAAVDGGDSVQAAAVLCQLLVPGVLSRLFKTGAPTRGVSRDELNVAAAEHLWMQCRTFPWRTHRKIAASITPHEAFPVGGSVPGVRVGPGCVQGGTGFRIGSGAASLEVCGRF